MGMRSEAPVALDARGAQEVQNQVERPPQQYPPQYQQQQPQQYGSPPVYAPQQPAYGAPQGPKPAYGAPQGAQPAYGTAPGQPRGGMNTGMAPSPYAPSAGYMAASPTPVQAM